MSALHPKATAKADIVGGRGAGQEWVPPLSSVEKLDKSPACPVVAIATGQAICMIVAWATREFD
jgi:hypothetical protein